MIPVSNVVNSQSFSTWEQKTNQLATLMTSNVVTTDNSAGGSLTSGNGQVNGWLSVANLTISSNLLGGNNTNLANLNVGTNTGFFNGLTKFLSVASNSSGSNLDIIVNTVTFGPSTVISTNLNLSSNLTVNGAVLSNTSVGVGSNVSINTSSISIGNSTVNNQLNSTSYSGISNNSTNLGGHPSSYYANVTNPNFSTDITVGSNVFINTSGIGIGNSTVNTFTNSTIFSGIANQSLNSSNLGGLPASGYQTTAGLAGNVATLTANFATSAGIANNSNNFGGLPPSSYALAGNTVFSSINVGSNVQINTSSLNITDTNGNLVINSTTISDSNVSIIFQNSTINAVGNISLNGALMANGLVGLDGMVLTTSGDGSNVFWMGIQGNGTIGGTNACIQFANNGDFDGDANLTWSTANLTMYIGNTSLTNYTMHLNSSTFFLGNTLANTVINSTGVTITNVGTFLVGSNVSYTSMFPDANRNKLINGTFIINQNGLFANANNVMDNGTNSQSYVIDRWYINYANMSSGNTALDIHWGQDQGAGGESPLEQFSHYFEIFCGAAAVGVLPNQRFSFAQNIEQQKLQGLNIGYANAVPMVLSFWVYTNRTGNMGGCIQANSFSYPFTYAVVSNVWTKAVVNIAPLTTGGNTFFTTNTANVGLTVLFEHGAMNYQNSTFLAPSGNVGVWSNTVPQYICPKTGLQSIFANPFDGVWAITGVQLEAGKYPSQYGYRTETEETIDCLRYFWNGHGGVYKGYAGIANLTFTEPIRFPIPMRAAPTVVDQSAGITNIKSFTMGNIDNEGADVTFVANAVGVYQYNGQWYFSAEI